MSAPAASRPSSPPPSFRYAGWCLDGNGNGGGLGAVYVTPCNGGLYQHFNAVPVSG